MSLSTIASKQAKATKTTLKNLHQVLDYLSTIRFHASDMILNIRSDASYLSAKNTKSRASGHLFLGSVPKDGEPITLNGACFTLCIILTCLEFPAVEAELGAIFVNVK